MNQSIVSSRGRTVIPLEIRERLGISSPTKLAWSTRNGIIIVVPIPEDPVQASFGILAEGGFTLDEFLKERRKERELDKRRDARLARQVRRTSGRRKA